MVKTKEMVMVKLGGGFLNNLKYGFAIFVSSDQDLAYLLYIL